MDNLSFSFLKTLQYQNNSQWITTPNENINQTKVMKLQEPIEKLMVLNKDSSLTTFVGWLQINIGDHNTNKTFRLCLVREQLEFQEVLAKVVSII